MGKSGSDLQENISITDGVVSGTLKYVTGYTGFSGLEAEQSGNYIAIKVTTSLVGGTTTVELINGTLGHPVELDADMNIVLRIADPITQSIEVVTTNDGSSKTETFTLTGLTLESAPDGQPE